MTRNAPFLAPILFVLATAPFGACSSEKKQPDCAPAAGQSATPQPKVETTPLVIDAQAGKKDNDWCRVCALGNKGYASCQRVYGDTPTEAREAIKERARKKACVDAGFTAENCPASAIIGTACKGDPPPAGAASMGDALQDLYRNLNPDGPVPPKQKDAKPAADAKAQTGAAGAKPDVVKVE
jgi:hypothetical protein